MDAVKLGNERRAVVEVIRVTGDATKTQSRKLVSRYSLPSLKVKNSTANALLANIDTSSVINNPLNIDIGLIVRVMAVLQDCQGQLRRTCC